MAYEYSNMASKNVITGRRNGRPIFIFNNYIQ